jgi:hypothetical protein
LSLTIPFIYTSAFYSIDNDDLIFAFSMSNDPSHITPNPSQSLHLRLDDRVAPHHIHLHPHPTQTPNPSSKSLIQLPHPFPRTKRHHSFNSFEDIVNEYHSSSRVYWHFSHLIWTLWHSTWMTQSVHSWFHAFSCRGSEFNPSELIMIVTKQ